ncbi:hypothetical protein BDN72DRAFT_857227 [Pluteus cervinus]|uniref:Uncharacterized protein n=1 Tax=Pluteus cervinus TaxID=181527 RepID=A0ACD3AXT0_9AGAR|nr:hypothetical protein BDN72DRAFT_857227 [Pluteus cervinus]
MDQNVNFLYIQVMTYSMPKREALLHDTVEKPRARNLDAGSTNRRSAPVGSASDSTGSSPISPISYDAKDQDRDTYLTGTPKVGRTFLVLALVHGDILNVVRQKNNHTSFLTRKCLARPNCNHVPGAVPRAKAKKRDALTTPHPIPTS